MKKVTAGRVLGGLLLGAAAFVGFLVYLAVIGGWALELVWNWFVVPVSTSIPHLNFNLAVGLSFAFGYIISRAAGSYPREENTSLKYSVAFFGPFITILIGYPLHLILS